MSLEWVPADEEYLQQEKNKQDRRLEADVEDPFYLSAPGSYLIRVLPPHKDSINKTWIRGVTQYYIPVEKKFGMWVTAPPAGETDPIANARMELIESGTPVNMEKAKKLTPRAQYLMNVLVLGAPPGVEYQFGKVYTIKVGEMIKRHLLELDQDKSTGWNGIWLLDNGVNINITRSGQGLDTKYTVTPHGGGRTDIIETLTNNGVDVDELELHNLDRACPTKDPQEVMELLKRGGFIVTEEPAPMPTPVAVKESTDGVTIVTPPNVPKPPSVPPVGSNE